jgi:Na+-driven multidrug efflux pump
MEQNTENTQGYQSHQESNSQFYASQQPQMPLYSYVNDNEKVMSVGDWLLTMVVMMIPLVNVIMVFVWAFGAGNKNRSNWAKAAIVMWLIVFALYIGIILIGAVALGGFEELIEELEYM